MEQLTHPMGATVEGLQAIWQDYLRRAGGPPTKQSLRAYLTRLAELGGGQLEMVQ